MHGVLSGSVNNDALIEPLGACFIGFCVLIAAKGRFTPPAVMGLITAIAAGFLTKATFSASILILGVLALIPATRDTSRRHRVMLVGKTATVLVLVVFTLFFHFSDLLDLSVSIRLPLRLTSLFMESSSSAAQNTSPVAVSRIPVSKQYGGAGVRS